MVFRSKFIVELKPPTNPANLNKYYARICRLVGITGRVSIASKPSAPGIGGFETSLNLARYLRQRQPDVDILFHVTCHDLNRVNIATRLGLLRDLGVGKILVLTGDDYAPPLESASKWHRLFYKDSLELLVDLTENYKWFQTIAIGGYPGGDGRRTQDDEQERARLFARLANHGANAVYTQCVFDVELFGDFSRQLEAGHSRIEIVPSVALFRDAKDLDRIADLTRVRSPAFDALSSELTRIDLGESSLDFSIRYLEQLCRKLLRSGAPAIDLCTFGHFELAEALISRLERD